MRLENNTRSTTTSHATLLQPSTLTASVNHTQSAIIIGTVVLILLYQLCMGFADMSRNDFSTILALLLSMTSMIAASAIDQVLQAAVSLLAASLRNAFERIIDVRISEAIRIEREIHDEEHRQRHPWLLEGSKHIYRAARNIDRALTILDALQVDEESTDRLGSTKYWLQSVGDILACDKYLATPHAKKELRKLLPEIEATLSEAFHDEVSGTDIILREFTFGIAHW
ncbi:hypothetical protein LTR56_009023 [Elasticomyces elasticus]|nr:hypothetical protein LTR56_009023 [Elasticomyces elasticus]KAK3663824.1 hypothetical protein LTR22_005285 [Elasticomyces elasticus]KAK4923968.1 hypothetical protein LTR49_008913 [Elasticomyces elasticus]KAK5762156.1 hypothetical protein LTS12_007677 [Elasticomyces elasticus]